MIFLSHSWTTKSTAYELLEGLLHEGVSGWLDDQQLSPGAKLRPDLLHAISDCSVYLYLISQAANRSDWVRDELEHALSCEHDGHLRVVPVRLVGDAAELPEVLRGRLVHDLDPSRGGIPKLAAMLRDEDGAQDNPAHCRVSATIRLRSHGLEHTVDRAREFVDPGRISVLMLNEKYESMEDVYWALSEIEFPMLSEEDPHRIETAVKTVTGIHDRCRRIVAEVPRLARGYVERSPESPHFEYFRMAFERSVRVLLHRLAWYIEYLHSLRDAKALPEDFMARRDPHSPHDGHACNFLEVHGDQVAHFGTIEVPPHGHPYSLEAPLMPWGFSSPFSDMLEGEVGEALGHLAAKLFLGEARTTGHVPEPDTLRYGLG